MNICRVLCTVMKVREKQILQCHSQVESKNAELVETESSMVVTRNWGWGEKLEILVKEYILVTRR